MGFPMASNLRKKIPKESVLYVNDVNKAAVERFVKELGEIGPVKALETAKEIIEASVVSVRFCADAGCNLLDCAKGVSCQKRLPR
jgi:3-hydroxyisobutyrate/3-hydroxypropionate dehydrogenase